MGEMKMNAIDKLIEKIKQTGNPTVIGLDPRYEMLPKCVTEKYPSNLEGVSQAIIEYNKELIDATCDIIPAIKPQIAFYEMYGIHGMKVFKETCEYAKQKGYRFNSSRIFKCIFRKNKNRR